jgi:hypothetical protein
LDWALDRAGAASARLDALIWRKSEIMDIFLRLPRNPRPMRGGQGETLAGFPAAFPAGFPAAILSLGPIASTDTINAREARRDQTSIGQAFLTLMSGP